jgi:FkbH-like protein
MRAIGGNPFHVRRILLQAAEMQTVTVTTESSRRTEMIRAQMERESVRATVSVEDFAREQKTIVKLSTLASAAHKRFPRAHELINKTNQFNTTGRRWTTQDCDAFFNTGGVFAVFEVEDRFTHYGLVGVVLLRGNRIVQWVMSCRVLGMAVEQSVMAALVAHLRAAGPQEIEADFVATAVNGPCHQPLPRSGFVASTDRWVLPGDQAPSPPLYVTLVEPDL